MVGVENRVEELAGIENPVVKKKVFQMLPLHEIISFALGVGMNSKAVWNRYNKLIEEFGNELNILLIAGGEKLARFVDEKIADLIIKNREGVLEVVPGFDGVYGYLKMDVVKKQKTLF